MASNREKILLVENNPEISAFLANQALKPLGYQITIETESSAAIQRALRLKPDAVLANIDLPGLSGKDLLVALTSQGIHVPVIMIAERGLESKVIQAFRLGATDCLFWPVREAEVVSAVERALNLMRSQHERDHLATQLQTANEELQQRLQELTALYNVGKAVVSTTDQKQLFNKIVQGAVTVTEADAGWFLRRDEVSHSFLLANFHNLPKGPAANLQKPWDDGISAMVALSGEPLAIHGEPIRRFKIALLGLSALVVPVKVKKEVIGLLEVVRKTDQPFTIANQKLLETIADYASISVVNSQLFHFLEERAQTLQEAVNQAQISAQIHAELYQRTARELGLWHKHADEHLAGLLKNTDQLNAERIERLRITEQSLQNIGRLLELAPFRKESLQTSNVTLNELLQASIDRYQPFAVLSQVSLEPHLAEAPLIVQASPVLLTAALDGLISNAIKFSLNEGRIIVHLGAGPGPLAHIQVEDSGIGIASKDQELVLTGQYQSDALSAGQTGGVGISLPLIRRIIETSGGKIWFESSLGNGTTFHITLPLAP